MQLSLLILAALTAALFLKTILDIAKGKRRIAPLQDIPQINPDIAPLVSVVIPACNEERSIEHALESVLAQNYPRLEVIAVNDRSTDQTGAILDRLAARSPILKVVHLTELPSGWLGKNHALQSGASAARGEWILFADADVVMDPSVLSRAIHYARNHQLGHLAAAPRAVVHGFLTKVFLGGFALMFTMHTRPWKIRDAKAKEYIGIGAFNLVRATAYRSLGGHQRIAMRPDDDLKLGKLLKYSGFKSDFVNATDLLCVEWYHSFREMRSGLMKNFFSVFEYNLALAVAACVLQGVVFVWPLLAIFTTQGFVRISNILVLACACLAFVANSTLIRIGWYWCFTLPLAGALSIYLIMRAAVVTIANHGIDWRGTHYGLDQLRANRF
jgi:cellulose synthase/poly-beta-1,6-N-acetylglucosamine synthase-like glycosyltransferase